MTTVQTIQLIILAALAAVVLFNLYAVLGKRVGRQPEDMAPAGMMRRSAEQAAVTAEVSDGVALSGLAAVKAKDPSFEIDAFLRGARSDYETIVKAYAENDRSALKSRVDAAVYSTFEAAMDDRERAGIVERVEFVAPARADLDHAELDGDQLRMRVRFLSEYRTFDQSAGAVLDPPRPQERRAAEVWTFERAAVNRDATWTLSRVEPAEV